ncbi:hypothetical protein ABW19_dt0202421 [Dactylella cylindrospora]|nr:hypothetical protein ABW19_dt0202421 [Dactylella cylindrospora]
MDSLAYKLQSSTLAEFGPDSLATSLAKVVIRGPVEPETHQYYLSLDPRFVDIYTRDGEIPLTITWANALQHVIERWDELVKSFEQVRDKAPTETVNAYIAQFQTLNEAFFMERNRLFEACISIRDDDITCNKRLKLAFTAMDRAHKTQYYILALRHEVQRTVDIEAAIDGLTNL